MNMDTTLHYLQSDLRHCLENPTDEAKAELIAAIDDLLSDTPQADPEESGRWWALKMLGNVRLFAERPNKACYRSLVRMIYQYWGLVNKGLIIPQGMTRSLTFDGSRNWWPQELEDKIIVLISNPTSQKVKALVGRLDEYCVTKQIDTA